jgi:hypothetical protein
VTKMRHAVLIVLAGLAPMVASAEDAAKPDNHGYFGVGLVLENNTLDDPTLGDVTSRGGGLILNGAGVLGTGSGIKIGVNGGIGFTSRTLDDYDVTVAEGMFDANGGVIVADLLYLSIGLQVLSQTDDQNDVMVSYTTIPLGIGVMSGSDTGYFLAQLRFGGGQESNDQNNSTEDLGYFGLRLQGQTGTADGLQFMGGMELDSYDFKDFDSTDGFFRIFFGVGFGG